MKKSLLLLSAMFAVFTSKSQAIVDSIDLSANYANQAFYDVSTGTKTVASNTDWDLQFFTNLFTVAIRINSGAGVELYEVTNGDTANFLTSTLDTVGKVQARDGNQDWIDASFKVNATGHPDYGWGKYGPGNVVVGKKVFAIKLTSGVWKKIWIKSMSPTGEVLFTTADFDGSNDVTSSFNRNTYSTKFHVYFDVENDVVIDAEPIKADWEIVFRRYVENVGGGQYYPVVGGFTQILRGVSQVNNTSTSDALANFTSNAYDTIINTIGHDWKSFNNGTFSWEIQDSLSYFLIDNNEDIYHLVFTGFGGSMNGKIYLTRELVGTVGIEENDVINKLSVYPNPAQDLINIVTDLSIDQTVDFTLMNVNGQIVRTFSNNELTKGLNQGTLNISDVKQGVYFLNVTTQGAIISTTRIVKL